MTKSKLLSLSLAAAMATAPITSSFAQHRGGGSHVGGHIGGGFHQGFSPHFTGRSMAHGFAGRSFGGGHWNHGGGFNPGAAAAFGILGLGAAAAIAASQAPYGYPAYGYTQPVCPYGTYLASDGGCYPY